MRLLAATGKRVAGVDREICVQLILKGVHRRSRKPVELRIPTTLVEAEINEDAILGFGWCRDRGIDIYPRQHGVLCIRGGRSIWVEGVRSANPDFSPTILSAVRSDGFPPSTPTFSPPAGENISQHIPPVRIKGRKHVHFAPQISSTKREEGAGPGTPQASSPLPTPPSPSSSSHLFSGGFPPEKGGGLEVPSHVFPPQHDASSEGFQGEGTPSELTRQQLGESVPVQISVLNPVLSDPHPNGTRGRPPRGADGDAPILGENPDHQNFSLPQEKQVWIQEQI